MNVKKILVNDNRRLINFDYCVLFQESKATKIKEYCFEKSIVYTYDFR